MSLCKPVRLQKMEGSKYEKHAVPLVPRQVSTTWIKGMSIIMECSLLFFLITHAQSQVRERESRNSADHGGVAWLALQYWVATLRSFKPEHVPKTA
jgi:hypothetical protein